MLFLNVLEFFREIPKKSKLIIHCFLILLDSLRNIKKELYKIVKK